ncbi:MAG: hypothetical protein GY859_42630 [Desulfobacterales bacterium]|nr:hypothetical protein [Desulfobacterales bacterium]
MKPLAIIQARMPSEWFPGKMLYKVTGKSVLKYLLENPDQCRTLYGVLTVTSNEP